MNQSIKIDGVEFTIKSLHDTAHLWLDDVERREGDETRLIKALLERSQAACLDELDIKRLTNALSNAGDRVYQLRKDAGTAAEPAYSMAKAHAAKAVADVVDEILTALPEEIRTQVEPIVKRSAGL
jgi:hypothetical protein